VVQLSDRAFSIGTSTNPLIGLLRAHLAPWLAPLGLRLGVARERAFRTISELAVHYRRSPIVEEGRPRLEAGARAGDRLPDAQILDEGATRWLQDVLAAPDFHLLLCGPPDEWSGEEVATWSSHRSVLVTTHRLARQAAPSVLVDRDGEALSRLGVKNAAHFLVRPDGYIAYRAAGTDLRAVGVHLDRSLRGGTTASSWIDKRQDYLLDTRRG
jgi:hypothetical protein